MKFPSSLRPGLAVLLTAIALYVVPIVWIKTRNFVPLDRPVTFSNGHYRSPDFKIDLRGTYSVDFQYSFEPDLSSPNCSANRWQSTRWKVFKNGRPVPVIHDRRSEDSNAGEFTGQYFDFFDADPGAYSVDLEVAPEPECSKMTSAWLWISTSSEKYHEHDSALTAICIFLGSVGIVFLLRGASLSAQSQSEIQRKNRLPISDSPGYIRNFGSRKRRAMSLFHTLPDFGIMHIVIVLPLLIVCLFAWMSEAYPVGIGVLILTPSQIRTSNKSRPAPLRVWLNVCGEFLVNEKPVPRNDLQDAVRYELAHRANEIVYFGADGNPTFAEAAFAMNEIRLAGGKVVWLTPKTSSEISSH